MARPIAPTPVLLGKDAERFVAKTKNPQPYTPKTFDIKAMAAAVVSRMAQHGQKQG